MIPSWHQNKHLLDSVLCPCRPPKKSPRPLKSLQKTRYATSRNPRNGAAILAVPRLNLLCSCSLIFYALFRILLGTPCDGQCPLATPPFCSARSSHSHRAVLGEE